jgi:hypothetical protein
MALRVQPRSGSRRPVGPVHYSRMVLIVSFFKDPILGFVTGIQLISNQFCSPEMLERFAGIRYIAEYMHRNSLEVSRYNADRGIQEKDTANARHLTNIGTFRAYVNAYLQNHPMIMKPSIYPKSPTWHPRIKIIRPYTIESASRIVGFHYIQPNLRCYRFHISTFHEQAFSVHVTAGMKGARYLRVPIQCRDWAPIALRA